MRIYGWQAKVEGAKTSKGFCSLGHRAKESRAFHRIHPIVRSGSVRVFKIDFTSFMLPSLALKMIPTACEIQKCSVYLLKMI